MPGTITVGLDGTDHALAAADWAANEATRRGMDLRLVHAWVWRPTDTVYIGDRAMEAVGAQRAERGGSPRGQGVPGPERHY